MVAPYLLTALIERPRRLIYLSSMMHKDAVADLSDPDWTGARATQVWLATSEDPAAQATGQFWQHMAHLEPHPKTRDVQFQRELADELSHYTGVALPA